MIDEVVNTLKNAGIPVINAEFSVDETIGEYVIVTLDCGKREALRLWPDIAGLLGVPVFVMWSRDDYVPPEEAGKYVGSALAKMDIPIITSKEPVDVVSELNDEYVNKL